MAVDSRLPVLMEESDLEGAARVSELAKFWYFYVLCDVK